MGYHEEEYRVMVTKMREFKVCDYCPNMYPYSERYHEHPPDWVKIKFHKNESRGHYNERIMCSVCAEQHGLLEEEPEENAMVK